MEKYLELVNNKILQIKFADSTDGEHEELNLCDEYKDKLIECISLINPLQSQISQLVGTGSG